MVGFSEDPAWGKACTPGGGSNTGPYSERSAWDNACTPGGITPPPLTCIRLTQDITLSTLTLTQGIKITGSEIEKSGYSVSGVGDINGDGYADFIIGAPYFQTPGPRTEGRSYLIYGSASLPATINLDSLGSAGITITGSTMGYSYTSYSVSSAGDVDKDGFADFIIGAPEEVGGYGRVYLIYGSSSPSDINLPSLGSAGITINGDAISFGKAGYSVSGVGDINGDGYADFIIGAPEMNSVAGASYLIYGDTRINLPETIDLSSLGTSGITITGDNAFSGKAGYSVSGAGDVNKDGFADFIIGAPEADEFPLNVVGKSYLIFGNTKANLPLTIDINTQISNYGITITGEGSQDRSGASVGGAGDVNKDGFDDIIIGAPGAGGAYTGGSYLIFGKENGWGDIDLSTLSLPTGITIVGGATNDQTGTSVSGAGDVDGDGYADFIIGAPGGSEGKSYLIYGSTSPSDINLNALGSAGITITGVTADQSGFSVSDAGDINKNGCADLIIGAPGAGSNAGESYIIYG